MLLHLCKASMLVPVRAFSLPVLDPADQVMTTDDDGCDAH